MKIAKSVVIGAIALASLAFVGACSDDKGGSSTSAGSSATAPAPSKAPTGTELLTAAINKTTGASYKFKGTISGGTVDGATDPAAGVSAGKIAIQEQGVTLSIESVLTPTAYYAKISGLPLPGFDGKTWLKLDPAKLTVKDALGFGDPKDPVELKSLPGNIATAETTDGKSIKGTMDFTKKTWGSIDDNAVKALGDKAKTVPFEATVDDKGNLTSLKVSVPAYGDSKAEEIALTFSDFGSPVTATTPPASEVTDAPASVYQLLNQA
ncbi:hypothetical protein ABZS66_33210 [Dactylosporangium sp. NPDC005572]|uniref:hypothetical protein n=1 Tax=Dactylosporangium sp. NPDC005572 TaxID=3156889 RepID=UPI0033BDFEBA